MSFPYDRGLVAKIWLFKKKFIENGFLQKSTMGGLNESLRISTEYGTKLRPPKLGKERVSLFSNLNGSFDFAELVVAILTLVVLLYGFCKLMFPLKGTDNVV